MTDQPPSAPEDFAGVLRNLLAGDASGRALVEQFLALVADAIVITDEQNRILAVNRAFETITGYTQAEVAGRNPSMLSSGHHSRQFYDRMWTALSEEGRWQGEIWNRRKSGEVYAEWLSIRRFADAQGITRRFVGAFSDLGAAHSGKPGDARDRLTGTPASGLLHDRIEQLIHKTDRERNAFALVLLDLDRFGSLNAKLGHEAGDRVLIEVAGRLRDMLRDEDTVSRTGGDEFALLLPRASHETAEVLADRIEHALPRPMDIDGRAVTVTCSMGIVSYPADGRDAPELLGNAREALRLAIADAGQTYRFHDAQVAQRMNRRSGIRRALRETALERCFRLVYLPEVDLGTGRVEALEALLRWNGDAPDRPAPEEFIPLAEESGHMPRIGEWLVERALREARDWGLAASPSLRLSVNISPVHLAEPGFSGRLLETLRAAGWPPDRFEIDITERAHPADRAPCIASILHLRAAGVRVALDDFGAGQSSLTSLRELALSTLKIDARIVSRIGRDARDEALVASIASIARALGLHCIGEGIETDAQRAFLRQAGVVSGQGAGIAPVLEGPDVARWLDGNRR
jgi:diguanylate cyclase (GGDEF)-like protein/PAS domain S-box-containing protein